MPHKFAVGDNVHFRPVVSPIDMAGRYVVTIFLPDIDGEFGYRIKNPNELLSASPRKANASFSAR